jgi:hypothetical protein
LLAILVREDSEGKRDNISEWFFYDIFSETWKKRLSSWWLWSCCCSLLVSINVLEHTDASFNCVNQSYQMLLDSLWTSEEQHRQLCTHTELCCVLREDHWTVMCLGLSRSFVKQFLLWIVNVNLKNNLTDLI